MDFTESLEFLVGSKVELGLEGTKIEFFTLEMGIK